jgi:type I restriction enzyme R subunit
MRPSVYPLPFIYESTGKETRFTNGYDPDARSRLVSTFHRPETLAEWLQQIAVILKRRPSERASGTCRTSTPRRDVVRKALDLMAGC